MGRIVLLGATGYTGRLAARACVAAGLRPVLAGRNQAKLEALAAALGDLQIALADVDEPATVRALVEPGDVLITTVGPYVRYGASAIEAAVDAGAHYLDLGGEPPFIRRVFQEYGPRAEAAGLVLLPAFGHDWVPGNLAAALALRDAGGRARRLHVGYFDYIDGKWFTGAPMSVFTSGTLATLASDHPPESYAFRAGKLVDERLGRRVRRFDIDGRRMTAFSYGGTEQFALPRVAPELTDVEVYLGWLGQASLIMSASIAMMSAASRLPPVRRWQRRRFEKALQITGQGPDSWPEHGKCRTVALCTDGNGHPVARIDLTGPVDGYQLTGQLLAWGAGKLAAGQARRAGACGPVDAFGLDVVEPELAGLGLVRI